MQRRILELANEIRQFVNEAGQQLMYGDVSDTAMLDEWVATCLAMDTLEDSTRALIFYKDSGVGDNVQERHIRIYGMFQAVILQQQAIARLYELFIGDFPKVPRDSGWRRINKIYEMAVASPLEGWRPDAGQAVLSQINITEDGFYIVMWDKEQWETHFGEARPERIDPVELLEAYSETAVERLAEINESLEALQS